MPDAATRGDLRPVLKPEDAQASRGFPFRYSQDPGFRSLQESIDTTSSVGKLIFHLFASLAEFERDIIRERTLAGLASARARGRLGGRPKALDAQKAAQAKAMHMDKTIPVKEICQTLGIGKTTLYRYLKQTGTPKP